MRPSREYVDIHPVGDTLVLQSQDQGSIIEAIRQVVREGGRVLRQPTNVGFKWVATALNPKVCCPRSRC